MRIPGLLSTACAALWLILGSPAAHPDDAPGAAGGPLRTKARVKFTLEAELRIEQDSDAAATSGSETPGRQEPSERPSSQPVLVPQPNQPSPQQPADSVKKLALLVGINRYQYPEIPRLSGAVNDVKTMQKLLTTRFGFPQENVLVLTDVQATRAAILRAFREHLVARTKDPGDEVVVFHYSGHGSQRATNDPRAENGWYETIVPHDSGRENHPNADIIDYELGNLFNELRANTRLITFILDSCHSGDATRDIDQAREAPRDPRLLVPEEGAARGLSGEGKRDYAMISGCRSNERSYEYSSGGQRHGTLTFFLVNEIEQAIGTGATYQEIFDKASIQVNRAHPFQHPQLEGTGANREFFGVKAVATQPYVLVSPQGDRAVFQAGQVHGMTPGSVFDVYPPRTRDFKGQATARFVLKEVDPLTSRGDRVRGGPIPDASRAVEREHNYENERIRVFFDPTIFDPKSKERKPVGSPLRDAVRARLETAARLAARFKSVDREPDASVTLRIGKDAQGKEVLVLSRRGDPGQSRTFPVGGPDRADHVMDELARWANAHDAGQAGSQGLHIEDRNDVDALPSVQDRLEEARGLAATFQLVDREESPDLVVRREREAAAVSLIKGDLAPKGGEAAISPPVREDEAGAIDHVMDQLNSWARWLRLSRLKNPKGVQLASFEVRRVTADGRVQVANDRDFLRVQSGEPMELTITNESRDDIYVTILDLSSDGEVSLVYPRHVPKPLPPGVDDKDRQSKAVTIPLTTTLNPEVNTVRDELRMIVTRQPVDLRFLEQSAPKGLDYLHDDPPPKTKAVEKSADPLARLMAQAGLAQRRIVLAPVGMDDWSTITRLVEVVK